MPTVNIYTSQAVSRESLERLRLFTAKVLSGNARQLNLNEVSVRHIVPMLSLSISPIEIEITAHCYPERVAKQDDLALQVKDFAETEFGGNAYCWILLCELGHSSQS
jgi:hypothetical protein